MERKGGWLIFPCNQIPDDGEKAIVERYEKLYNDMMELFASVSDE